MWPRAHVRMGMPAPCDPAEPVHGRIPPIERAHPPSSQGEVDVLSYDGDFVERRLTPEKETVVYHHPVPHPVPPFEITHSGCFGESVLSGRRRPATYRAHTLVEALVVSKDGLQEVIEVRPSPNHTHSLIAC